MIRIRTLEYRFVRSVPRILEPGILYVSMDYATAVHSCCCGCGEQVVTPLSPTDWKMTYDGESVSLTPSIGNWQLPCRSHYFIRQGQVIEAEPKRPVRIATECRRNEAAYLGGEKSVLNSTQDLSFNRQANREVAPPRRSLTGLWSTVAAWFSRDTADK